MNLIHDLGSELALAVLVNKKHQEKIGSKDILPLIGKLENALKDTAARNELDPNTVLIPEKAIRVAAR